MTLSPGRTAVRGRPFATAGLPIRASAANVRRFAVDANEQNFDRLAARRATLA
jgi:hypothetical protein